MSFMTWMIARGTLFCLDGNLELTSSVDSHGISLKVNHDWLRCASVRGFPHGSHGSHGDRTFISMDEDCLISCNLGKDHPLTINVPPMKRLQMFQSFGFLFQGQVDCELMPLGKQFKKSRSNFRVSAPNMIKTS